MSRTHTTSSYGFRSLGIAGFVVAVSFFANTAPALAFMGTASSQNSSSQTTWHDEQGGQHGGNWTSSSREMSSAGGHEGTSTQFGGGGNGGDGYGGSESLPARMANLQERIKRLDDMKAQLEKLLLSLQQRASTTPDKPKCPIVLGRLFGGGSASTSTSHEGCRPLVQLPHPILCALGSHPEMQWGNNAGTTTPACRPNRDDSHSTSTCATGRCGEWGSGMNPWNHGSTTSYGNPGGWKEHTSSSSNVWSQGFGGGSFGAGSNGSFTGQVHGASSDMSAEMADTLDSLKGDLLDISDMLNQ